MPNPICAAFSAMKFFVPQLCQTVARRGRVALCMSALLFCSACSGNLGRGFLSPHGPDGGETAREARGDLDLHYFGMMPAPKRVTLPKPALDVTPEVQREIRAFTKCTSSFVRLSLVERSKNAVLVERIFDDEGLPKELINVALIESGFRNDLTSHAGAAGMWQFMKSTARVYGLRVAGAVDERRDPVLASLAAARHLKDLYRIYNDWPLALAAYNAGTGTIRRAQIRSKLDDFWSLARAGHLRRETVQYVARFIAATLITSNPENYGMKANQTQVAMAADGRRIS